MDCVSPGESGKGFGRRAEPRAELARAGLAGIRREAEVRALCDGLAERFGECGLGCLSVDPQAKAMVEKLAMLGATPAELGEASSAPPCATAIVAIAVEARKNEIARAAPAREAVAPPAAGAAAAGAEAKSALSEGFRGCGRVGTRRG
ncbi:MAG: hypothetical protein PHF51_00650 [Candidatus ainarchaeum sp.]|nr:hypothetical protein [Candidatus ainarchaeum sp.]